MQAPERIYILRKVNVDTFIKEEPKPDSQNLAKKKASSWLQVDRQSLNDFNSEYVRVKQKDKLGWVPRICF